MKLYEFLENIKKDKDRSSLERFIINKLLEYPRDEIKNFMESLVNFGVHGTHPDFTYTYDIEKFFDIHYRIINEAYKFYFENESEDLVIPKDFSGTLKEYLTIFIIEYIINKLWFEYKNE